MSNERDESEVDWLKILLGAFAIGGAYLIFTRYASASPSAPQKPDETPSPPKTPPLSPSSSYESPDRPGHEIFVPGGSTMPTSSTLPAPGPNQIALHQGKTYRARLQLSGLEKFGSREQIAASFSSLGFQSVRVFMNQNELPGGPDGWPGAPSSDGGARWAEGVWTRGDENVDRPPQVVEAREV